MDRSSLKVAQTMRSGQPFGFKLPFGKRICHKGMMYSNLQLTAESNYVILYSRNSNNSYAMLRFTSVQIIKSVVFMHSQYHEVLIEY